MNIIWSLTYQGGLPHLPYLLLSFQYVHTPLYRAHLYSLSFFETLSFLLFFYSVLSSAYSRRLSNGYGDTSRTPGIFSPKIHDIRRPGCLTFLTFTSLDRIPAFVSLFSVDQLLTYVFTLLLFHDARSLVVTRIEDDLRGRVLGRLASGLTERCWVLRTGFHCADLLSRDFVFLLLGRDFGIRRGFTVGKVLRDAF